MAKVPASIKDQFQKLKEGPAGCHARSRLQIAFDSLYGRRLASEEIFGIDEKPTALDEPVDLIVNGDAYVPAPTPQQQASISGCPASTDVIEFPCRDRTPAVQKGMHMHQPTKPKVTIAAPVDREPILSLTATPMFPLRHHNNKRASADVPRPLTLSSFHVGTGRRRSRKECTCTSPPSLKLRLSSGRPRAKPRGRLPLVLHGPRTRTR